MAQQNLDFNIVAHTQGMEAIAQLINRVGALEAETKKLATANAGLAASTNTVVQNGTRYNNALDAQSKQLRQARQGTQQLGMQINDFATSVSTGASVSQAFNQQLGQLGFAMSMMGGTAGKVGAFLAGPWGAAITLAVVALGPFIDKLGQAIMRLFDTETALDRVSKKAKESMANLANSVAQASLESTAMTDVAMEYATASRAYAKANKALQDARRMGPADEADPGSVFAHQRRLENLAKAAKQAETAMKSYQGKVDQIQSIGRVKAMQRTNEEILGTAPKKPKAPRKEALTDAQKEAKKIAEATARWDRMMAGDRVEEYQDMRTRDIKSAEAWKDTLSKLDDEISVNAIDAAAKRMQEIGYIVDEANLKIADEFQKPYEQIQKSFESIGSSVSDAFKGMLSGAMSWKDGMKSLINSVIDELWRLYVVQQIVGFVKTALSSIGLPLPNIEGKAVGGYVGANQPYVVGERGPELFVPGGSGTIIPTKNMGSASGGGGMVVNVDARGSNDPAAVRAQVEQGILQAAPAIIAAAQSRTVNSLRRPRLGGAMQ